MESGDRWVPPLTPAPGRPTTERDGPTFTLRWVLERADLEDAARGNAVFKRHRRRVHRTLVPSVLLVGVLVVFRPTWLSFALLVGALLGALLLETQPRLTAMQQWRANAQLRGEMEVTVSAAGVRARGPGAAAEYGWQVFRHVDETSRSFLLSSSLRAGATALVLPKRALAGPAEVAAMRDFLHRVTGGS